MLNVCALSRVSVVLRVHVCAARRRGRIGLEARSSVQQLQQEPDDEL